MIVHRTYVDLEGTRPSLAKVKELLKRNRPKVLRKLESSGTATSLDLWEALLNARFPQVANTCKVCRKPTTFRKNGDYLGYSEYCSCTCRSADPEHKAKVRHTYNTNPSNADIGERIRKVFRARYGVDNPGQHLGMQKRAQRTSLKRYGHKHHIASASVRKKTVATLLERHGVSSPGLIESHVAKVKATCLEKYGVDNPSKAESVKRKIVESNLASMGVPYAMQNPRSFARQQASAKAFKKLSLDGKTFRYQGYENHALRYLVKHKGIPAKHLWTHGPKIPVIRYPFEGKTKVFYPDILAEDTIIEVKSSYTLGTDTATNWFTQNQAKFKAVHAEGYRLEIWVVLPKEKQIVRFTKPHQITRNHVRKMLAPYI